MKRLTVDSSIIVSSLLENEQRHKEARKIWDTVLAGKNIAILPYSVFVEVVAAVRRRTRSEELAREVGKQFLEIEAVFLVGLDDTSASTLDSTAHALATIARSWFFWVAFGFLASQLPCLLSFSLSLPLFPSLYY